MELMADQAELFPVAHSAAKPKGVFSQWLEATDKHGPLLTPNMAAAAMALSRGRIHQLLNEGRLAAVNVGSTRMVPLSALELFMTEDRPAGRPRLIEKFTAGMSDRRNARLSTTGK